MNYIKKIYLMLLVACSSAGIAYAVTGKNQQPVQVSSSEHKEVVSGYKHGQCKAIAKSTGKRCRRGVSNKGDKYCFQHK